MNSKTLVPFGIKQGIFKVDTSGQSTYHVPIDLPPGINNHQPNIGLAYNHRQGNGACGVGWGISGLSVITRINANHATDGFIGGINYDANDRFVLDGQRLVNYNGIYGAGGTVYYTEIHSWRQIVAGATDMDGFTVYMKNGEIWRYGTTPNSLILTEDAKHVRVWALASIQDLNGNEITYSYTSSPTGTNGLNSTENYYISSIQYSGFTVSFNYSNRTPDVMVTYLGGYQITTSCILNSINVSLTSGETISSYSLNYETSIATKLNCLNSIVISDGAGNCLPSLQFDWQDISAPSFDTTQGASPLLNQSNVIQTIPMDVNGDGTTDIVQLYKDENNSIHAVIFLASNILGKITYTQQSDTIIGNYGSDYQILAGDCNGNGMCDLIIVYSDNSNNSNLSIDVSLSTGTGFDSPITKQTGDPWQGNSSINFYTIDVNGDGRTDLVQAFIDSSSGANLLSFNVYVSTFIGTEGNFSSSALVQTQSPAPSSPNNLWAIDVNGDGMVDMVLLWEDANNSLNTTSFVTTDSVTSGISFFGNTINSNLNTSTTNQVSILPADVNGDGIVDIIQICQSSSSPLTIQSFFSSANGSFIPGPTSTFQNQIIAKSFNPMGFNGGSQTCLLSSWIDSSSDWNFTLFNSSPNGTFNSIPSVNTQQGFPRLNFFIGDANGDGKADVFSYYLDSNNAIQLQPFPSEGPYPDLMNSITDMLGNCTTIVYAPLTNPAVYSEVSNQDYPTTSPVRYPSHLSPGQYPIQEVLGKAVYVVSTFSIKNDSTLNRFDYFHEYQMNYANASINLNGRGWQGFETVSKLDLQTGLRTIHTYNQEFPYTGTLISTQIEADANYSNDPKLPAGDANVLLSLSLNTYQSISHQALTTYGTAYEIQNTGDFSYQYDYGQANFDYLIAKSFNYDSYGNKVKDIWWGYIEYIDPSTINSLAPFPMVTPKASDEIVYTYRQFQNDLLTNGWALGYLLFEKESANSTDTDISTFQSGDFNLAGRTYAASTYNILTQAHWDNVNNCFLTTRFTYDQHGNHLTETKPGNLTTVYEYETTYNTYPSKVTSPPNEQGVALVNYHGYDPRFGIKVAHQDENDFIHIVSLDGFGRKVIKQGPVPSGCSQSDANTVTSFVTGTPAFIESVKTAEVLTLETIAFENDGMGGIYANQSSLQNFPTDSNRNFTWKQKYVDGLARECQFVVETGNTAGNSVVLTTYDPCGHPSSKSLPFFATNLINPTPSFFVNHSYDVLGRPLKATNPVGSDGNKTTTNTWDYALGEVVTITQASGADEQYIQKITNHLYNGKHRQIESCIPNDNNATTVFKFDALGRMLYSTDPVGIENKVTYDSLNRKLSYNNPDQNTTGTGNALSYSYDLTGKLKSVTYISNAVITYNYDQLGRVITQKFTDGRVFKFNYDTAQNGKGKLESVTINAADNTVESNRVFNSYDSYGNTIQETLTVNGATAPFITKSVFDPENRLITQAYPDSSILMRNYQFGLLTSQNLDGARIEYPLESYTALGKSGQVNYGNGLNLTYQYNPLGLLYGERIQIESQPALLNFSYEYDQISQLKSSAESINKRVEQFTYINKRLATANVPGFSVGNGVYTYDAGGNILTKDGNDYLIYSGHFPKTVATGTNVIYSATQDDCGRTLTRTRNATTLVFSYDGLGNVEKVMSGNTVLNQMMSDESGKRLKETKADGTVIYYVNSAYHLKIDKQGATAITKYLFDKKGTVASIESFGTTDTILYFRLDQKGNITHTFDTKGVIQSTITYDGFGQALALTGSDTGIPLYEGKVYDETIGLYYFEARYYDPILGRFISPDTHLGGQSHLQPDVWNRFAFELNNPTNRIDPTGHFSWKALGEGILEGVVATVVTLSTMLFAGPLAIPIGALAEAGVQEAFTHTSLTQFGKMFAADIATTGINMVVSIGALLLTPETGGASLVGAGVAIGTLAGAISGFAGSAVSQAITQNGHVNWLEVGESTVISAGIGAVVGGIGAKSGALAETKETGETILWHAKMIAKESNNIEEIGYNTRNVLKSITQYDAKRMVKFMAYRIAWDENITPYKSAKD